MLKPMLNISLLKHAISIAKWSEIYKLLSRHERHAAVLHIYKLLSEELHSEKVSLLEQARVNLG